MMHQTCPSGPHGGRSRPIGDRKAAEMKQKKSDTKKNILLAALAILALALFVAMGGDGRDLEDHARWMSEAKNAGGWVMW